MFLFSPNIEQAKSSNFWMRYKQYQSGENSLKYFIKRILTGGRILSIAFLTSFEVLLNMNVLDTGQFLYQSSIGITDSK
jgi:hypothetical protein